MHSRSSFKLDGNGEHQQPGSLRSAPSGRSPGTRGSPRPRARSCGAPTAPPAARGSRWEGRGRSVGASDAQGPWEEKKGHPFFGVADFKGEPGPKTANTGTTGQLGFGWLERGSKRTNAVFSGGSPKNDTPKCSETGLSPISPNSLRMLSGPSG